MAKAARSRKILNILYIEDEEDVRELTVQLLQARGYHVDAAETPSEAVDFLEPNKYQLAIVDIWINKKNSIQGDEFIAKCSDYLSNAKIIAYTGYARKIKSSNRRKFYKVIRKGDGEDLSKEISFVDDEYQKSKERQKSNPEDSSAEENILEKLDKKELEAIRKELIAEFKEVDEEVRTKPLVFYDGKDYSAEDLIKEIKDENSIVGRKHIALRAELNRKKKGGK